MVGIIGRNGAGKSTLLKILSRITEPTTGRVELHGRVGSLLEVGTGFHPELTGRENIYLNGAILGMTRARSTASSTRSSPSPRSRSSSTRRSSATRSGMYVRLAFAVAAHLEPEILLVDEVLAVGDAAFQKKCLGKMGDVAGEGRTVLFVSHNMAAVQNLCNIGIALESGRVEFCGGIHDAIDGYLGLASHQDIGHVDLSTHPGRPSKMQPVIKSIALRSIDDSRYDNHFGMGEDVVIEIGYDCQNIRVDFALIGIVSSMGARVCTVSTQMTPGFQQPIARRVLECIMPKLPLTPGEYGILVALGTKASGNVDVVDDAIRLHIELVDYFDTGAEILPGQGHLALQSKWRLVQA